MHGLTKTTNANHVRLTSTRTSPITQQIRADRSHNAAPRMHPRLHHRLHRATGSVLGLRRNAAAMAKKIPATVRVSVELDVQVPSASTKMPVTNMAIAIIRRKMRRAAAMAPAPRRPMAIVLILHPRNKRKTPCSLASAVELLFFLLYLRGSPGCGTKLSGSSACGYSISCRTLRSCSSRSGHLRKETLFIMQFRSYLHSTAILRAPRNTQKPSRGACLLFLGLGLVLTAFDIAAARDRSVDKDPLSPRRSRALTASMTVFVVEDVPQLIISCIYLNMPGLLGDADGEGLAGFIVAIASLCLSVISIFYSLWIIWTDFRAGVRPAWAFPELRRNDALSVVTSVKRSVATLNPAFSVSANNLRSESANGGYLAVAGIDTNIVGTAESVHFRSSTMSKKLGPNASEDRCPKCRAKVTVCVCNADYTARRRAVTITKCSHTSQENGRCTQVAAAGSVFCRSHTCKTLRFHSNVSSTESHCKSCAVKAVNNLNDCTACDEDL